MDVAILGAGRLADVVTKLLEASPSALTLHHWARREEAKRAFAKKHERVRSHESVASAASAARVVIFAVPTQGLEELGAAYGAVARGDQVVLHACRGAGPRFRLPHQILRGTSCVRKIVALGGPLHGRDLKSGRALAAAAASRFTSAIDAIRRITQGTPVRLHPSADVVGVEVAGAMSNVWALATGMSDALELGETARGLLLTRGLVEAQRIGLALGADPATFAGLAGVGDLIPRKVTSTERHHDVGAELARGGKLPEGELEGVITARGARELAQAKRLKLPLLLAVSRALEDPSVARAELEAVLALDLEDLVIPRAALER